MMAHYDGHVEAAQDAYVRKLEAENAELKAAVIVLNNVLRNAGWGQGEIDSAAYTEETIAKLKEELAQANRSYDGAVAAHHEAKNQYRDLIEAHMRELAGWEAAHVALNRENDQLKAELAQAKAREARLLEALKSIGQIRFLLGNDPRLNPAYEMGAIAEQALEEAGT